MNILEDSLKHYFFAEAKSNHFTPRCACATRGIAKYDFKPGGSYVTLQREHLGGRQVYI